MIWWLRQKRLESLALEVLEDVFVNQAPHSISLNKHLKGKSTVSSRQRIGDRAGLWEPWELKTLTLEWYLSHFIQDRDKLVALKQCPSTDECLSTQYLDKLPDHAVVNEAVKLQKARKKGSEKLVNALCQFLHNHFVREVCQMKRKVSNMRPK